MRVSIVVASRHGSTTEIGRAIAERLEQRGLTVSVAEPSAADIGTDDASAVAPEQVEDLTSRTNALGHHVFAGRLDHDELGLAERLVTKMVHAPDGDFRDWADIQSWADQIAESLLARNDS